jgi:hypothetical protein
MDAGELRITMLGQDGAYDLDEAPPIGQPMYTAVIVTCGRRHDNYMLESADSTLIEVKLSDAVLSIHDGMDHLVRAYAPHAWYEVEWAIRR